MDKESIKKQIIEMEIDALEKWNKGNPDGYLDIYSPDFTYFDPFQERRLDGYERIQELYESLRGKGGVDRYEMINPVVRLSENIAVLSYNLFSYAGKNVNKWNCTEVYQLNESNQ